MSTPKQPQSARSAKRTKTRPAQPTPYVALLRGINVGGNKKVPMAELRSLGMQLGLLRVETYIQSGNLVFLSAMTQVAVEKALEQAILDHFAFSVEVVVRSATEWWHYSARSPFPDAQQSHPNHLLLGLSKHPVKPGAAKALRPYIALTERVHVLDDAIWLDYAAAMAQSRLNPNVLDRCIGSTVTARNWSTVQKIAEMLRALEAG